ncbi:FGGY-family carbohydrate kinase [Roseivirga sp.]|uniref:FGGY-family carbohydrate kinase n=1 Tax=Roseivirga sp. TaxID=1964215 RepID=UPI003B51B54F
MSREAILIYDIGKTNKKCLVFDGNFHVIHEESKVIDETIDEEGDPCDDIQAISKWIYSTAEKLIGSDAYVIRAINFSAYGASLVHIDKSGKAILPLYNYLKPFSTESEKLLTEKFGSTEKLSQETASPYLGMLNSGLQLFWLKNFQPHRFSNIHLSLHFPQYLSYLFSQRAVSDYTSIGCHTMLWDFNKQDYHSWVNSEHLTEKLAPVTDNTENNTVQLFGKEIKVGTGIHDSSAALLPYLYLNDEPFALLSTGTWNISLNPFEEHALSSDDLENDCLMFMSTAGKKVKASRLFLGNEHASQVHMLTANFGRKKDEYKHIGYDAALAKELRENFKKHFTFSLGGGEAEVSWETLGSFKAAYHQLMIELCMLQVSSLKRAIGNSNIKTVFIDGGFVDNEIFINLLQEGLPKLEFIPAQFPVGSALGAALAIATKDQVENWKKQKTQLTLIS